MRSEYPMTSSQGPFPQKARKSETKLSNALANLHEGPAGDPLRLPERSRLGLQSRYKISAA